MKKQLTSVLILAAAVLFAACGGANQPAADGTEAISPENRVIYQMNIGAFTQDGTFKAAQERLPYLDSLGVDILWLMPIYPRGATMHSPYAAMDYKAVNPAYGTVEDVKAFVDAAHERDIKVWLDWVPNHVAVENPWVQEHPDYFTTDAKGQMIHPHGWGDVFELNYQNPELVKEVNSALRFWIDSCNVDGYRCDYVTSPTIPVKYWVDIIKELKNRGRTIEFMSETDISNPDNQRIDSCGFDYDYAWDFQEDLVRRFGSEGTQADSLKALCQKLLGASSMIKNYRMLYLTNHDQNYNDGGHTLRDFYGDNRYALTVLEFTLYGMPLLYQGQEIGDPDTLNYFTDAKVKWDKVDRKMQNTVRSLITLHHTQPSLAAGAPVMFLDTDNPSVMAYKRGDVVVVMNLAKTAVKSVVNIIDKGEYTQCLNSSTISDKADTKTVTLTASPSIDLEAKGYVVYIKQ